MIPTSSSACRSWVSPAPPSSGSISPVDSSSLAPSFCTGRYESASWTERLLSRGEKDKGGEVTAPKRHARGRKPSPPARKKPQSLGRSVRTPLERRHWTLARSPSTCSTGRADPGELRRSLYARVASVVGCRKLSSPSVGDRGSESLWDLLRQDAHLGIRMWARGHCPCPEGPHRRRCGHQPSRPP